jgi:hypothetical protein
VLLQTTFHGPLGYILVLPLPPIFTRMRTATDDEAAESGSRQMRKERSFYRNTYSMASHLPVSLLVSADVCVCVQFTDPTSYHALFYFLVIKPSITLLLSLFLALVVPVCLALVLPAPAMLRLVRRLGIWQANIAVEGLYAGGTG